jgi:hypothetical protein
MTPDEVCAMDDDTYRAFATYQRDEIRERKKAASKRGRGGR